MAAWDQNDSYVSGALVYYILGGEQRLFRANRAVQEGGDNPDPTTDYDQSHWTELTRHPLRLVCNQFFAGTEHSTGTASITTGGTATTYDWTRYDFQGDTLYFIDGINITGTTEATRAFADGGDGVWTTIIPTSSALTARSTASWNAFG